MHRGERTPFASMVVMHAQKVTPTRKTRRDDSFDRSSGDEEKEEEAGESSDGCGLNDWCLFCFVVVVACGVGREHYFDYCSC